MFKIRGSKGFFPNRPGKGLTILLAAGVMFSCYAHTSYKESVKAQQASRVVVPDETVVDQDGKPVKFYSELVQNKVVVISLSYTTCEAICSMQGQNLAKLQERLADQLGKDVHIISISLDPERDSPERLKAWGKKFGVRAGWKLVTGGKQEIDRIIKAFTGGPPEKEEHSLSLTLHIGNDSTGKWITAYGLTDPERLVYLINRVRD